MKVCSPLPSLTASRRFLWLIGGGLGLFFLLLCIARYIDLLPLTETESVLDSHLMQGNKLLRYVFFGLPLLLLPLLRKGIFPHSGGRYRRWIPFVAALSAYYWFYTPMYCLYGLIVIAALATLDAFAEKRKPERPTLLQWAWLAYGALQLIGMLWGPTEYAWKTGQTRISLFVFPLIACLYRPKKAEVMRFFVLAGRLLFLYLAFCFSVYLLYTAILGMNPMIALTFDKYYFSLSGAPFPFVSYALLLSWAHAIQPTFSIWLMLTIWLCNLWMYRTKGPGMRSMELLFYYLLMFAYAFAQQTRYGLLALCVLGVLVLLHFCLLRFRPSARQIRIFSVVLMSLFVSVLFVLWYFRPTFLQDEVRMELFSRWVTHYPDRWLFGWGTGGEKAILDTLHTHNDFLSALFNHGLPGLAVLLFWIAIWSYEAIHTRNALLSALGITTLGLMCIDGPLNAMYGISFLSLMLLFYPHSPQIYLHPEKDKMPTHHLNSI
ncbi:hypothetical protein HQ45_06000 [Porphyromonas crevioricanis]|uniref:hypothetical protein n=1 Tax=Porphyromonas crevioricanis TaxID=393921 RepID=UPI00052C9179|nr:hypothetical protein [Porphyromonas crevioricanis]KGN90322.1 hypothetical protein HQ45_06000 [Porphyromonas crevioricanis]